MRSCCTYHGHCAFCVWRAQSRRQTHSFWSAWHRFKQNATKDHMVVAMPSDRSHLHLVEGTRSWRKVCHHDSFISKSSFPIKGRKIKDDSLHMPPGPTQTRISTSLHVADQSCLGSVCCLVPVVYNPCNLSLQRVEPCIGLAVSLMSRFPSDFHLLTMACMDHLQLCNHAFAELSKGSLLLHVAFVNCHVDCSRP